MYISNKWETNLLPSTLLTCLLFFYPLITNNINYGYLKEIFVFSISIIFILHYLLFKNRIFIYIYDIYIAIGIIYIIFNIKNWDNDTYVIICYIILFFCISKTRWNINILLIIISISTIHALISIYNNYTSPLIGIMRNSGITGIYLAITYPIGFYFLLNTKDIMQKIIYGSNSVLIIISIYLTDSRNAILSISICTIYIYIKSSNTIINHIRKINIKQTTICILLFDKPILGFGYNTFYSVYPDYQASYFSTNPDSKYKIFADNTKYGFNEVLQIGVEYGIIGIILTLIFIIYLLTIKTNENKFIISPLKYSVLSILIVSLSSYPLRRVETLLTITILIGILASFEKRILFSFNKIQCKLLIILFSFFSFSFIGSIINRKNAYTIWQNTKNTSISDKEKMTIYNSIKDKLKYDTQFLYNYAVILSKCQKNEESNIHLDKILTHMNTSSIWILKGNNYKNINNLHEAIKCYTYASKIVPNRIFPLYQLMLIYKEYNKQNQMIKIAKHIKEFNVKIPSYTTQKIKEEANEIISIYN